MTLPPPVPDTLLDEVHELTLACLSGDARPEIIKSLDRLVCENDVALRIYVDAVLDGSILRRWVASAQKLIDLSDLHDLDAVLLPSAIADTDVTVATPSSNISADVPCDVVSGAASPLPLLSTTLPGTVGWFSSGWPVAYMIATLICGVSMLIGSVVHVSEPQQIAGQSVPLPSHLSPLPTMVGRVTGTVDCKWEGSGVRGQGSEPVVSGQWPVASGQKQSEPRSSSHQPPATSHLVSLGDKFALLSGLMEITYDTGARVILQGPVTYEVESKDGGYLSVGKVTARLEKNDECRMMNDELRTEGSDIHHSSFITHPLFAVRTPTATVIDLGTEFGVEVSKEGHTTSHVFRGSVRLQVASADGKAEGVAQVLHENQSARVENRGNRSSGNRITMLGPSAEPANFVRQISKQSVKIFDLVDVVAGGDGFSGRRNRGIDSTDGRVVDALPIKPSPWPMSDGRYHRVRGLPIVDGIFVPCGRYRPVQVDSAGHTFADCPDSNGDTSSVFWAGGAPLSPLFATRIKLEGIDYGTGEHGFFFLHANKGVTFDLEAIRRANPGYRLLRFRAVAGNVETASEKGESVWADFCVLVDGQSRFQRRQFSAYNGAAPIAIPLADNDRFLTLIATDGGNGIACDWIVFGDPRLELFLTTAR